MSQVRRVSKAGMNLLRHLYMNFLRVSSSSLMQVSTSTALTAAATIGVWTHSEWSQECTGPGMLKRHNRNIPALTAAATIRVVSTSLSFAQCK